MNQPTERKILFTPRSNIYSPIDAVEVSHQTDILLAELSYEAALKLAKREQQTARDEHPAITIFMRACRRLLTLRKDNSHAVDTAAHLPRARGSSAMLLDHLYLKHPAEPLTATEWSASTYHKLDNPTIRHQFHGFKTLEAESAYAMALYDTAEAIIQSPQLEGPVTVIYLGQQAVLETITT